MIDHRRLSELFARKNSGDCPTHEYNQHATAEWIRNSSQLPWLKLDVEIPVDVIHKEIFNVKHLLVDHRDSEYSEHNGWSSFCIHGKSYDATREDSHYNDSRPYIWTNEAEELMPHTVEYFKTRWPNAGYRRLRIMALEPKGYVSVHADTTPPDALRPINIAITQPNDCNFYMENYGTVPFTVGSAYILNISNRHTVINNSNQTRYHIIAHQDFGESFDNVLVRSYNKAYAS